MAKLNRIVSSVQINLPFQGKKFLLWLIVSIVCSILGFFILEIPKLGLMGLVILIVVYFIPSFLAFDVFQSYNVELNIPKLKHPKRILILIINFLLGIFVIGWILALFMALSPGRVTVEKVTYTPVE